MSQLLRYNFISSIKPHPYKGELSLNGISLRIVISILTDIWSMTITAIAYQVTCPADQPPYHWIMSGLMAEKISLPTGEMLDGKMAYSEIMAYFTTNDMTPDDVYSLGYKQVNKLYPQVSTSSFFLTVAQNIIL